VSRGELSSWTPAGLDRIHIDRRCKSMGCKRSPSATPLCRRRASFPYTGPRTFTATSPHVCCLDVVLATDPLRLPPPPWAGGASRSPASAWPCSCPPTTRRHLVLRCCRAVKQQYALISCYGHAFDTPIRIPQPQRTCQLTHSRGPVVAGCDMPCCMGTLSLRHLLRAHIVSSFTL
jgi:hypothetical protein